MQKYETLFICKPELAENEIQTVLDRLVSSIDRTGGKTVVIDEWGNRRLAYPVRYRGQKFVRGYYILLTYLGGGPTVEEMERNIKLMDEVFRYLTVRLEGEAQPEEAVELTRKRTAQAPEAEMEEMYGDYDDDDEYGRRGRGRPRGPARVPAEVPAAAQAPVEPEEPDEPDEPEPDEPEEMRGPARVPAEVPREPEEPDEPDEPEEERGPAEDITEPDNDEDEDKE